MIKLREVKYDKLYFRNLIYRKDVTIDCDIINGFEEKI